MEATMERKLQDVNLQDEIRELCIKNQYFTLGCNLTYAKMFRLVAVTHNVDQAAAIIWANSETEDLEDLKKIKKEIREIMKDLGIRENS